MSLLRELKRRNVLRAGAAYIVSAWLIIQVVETIFPAFGFGDAAVRILVIVLAIAFIPAMVVSWIFEWTPQGFRRESEVDDNAPSSIAMARRMDRWIMIVLALGLAYFAVDKFVLDPGRDEARVQQAATAAAQRARSEALVESYGEKSIAVLPFVNMSDDPGNEYFSDGISEELLNLLAKVPGLRVTSRSSSFTFKGKDVEIPEVAAQLSVTFILEGSVRKSGDRVRVTAQLIEGRSDTHVWSERYDRTLDDIFAIQDEISAAIVAELRTRIGLDVQNPPVTAMEVGSDAHDAYLRGQFLFWQREIEGAVAAFEASVALDPDFAPSQAGLALAYRFVSLYLGGDRDEWISRALPHAQRALELDPELPEAHAAMGYLLTNADSYDQGIAHFRTAIRLNPNYSDAYIFLAQRLENTGEFVEAFEYIDKASRLDPLSKVVMTNLIGMRLMQDRLEDVAAENDKLRSLDPDWYQLYEIDLEAAHGNWAEGALATLEAWSNSDASTSSITDQVIHILQGYLAAMGFPEHALPGAADMPAHLPHAMMGQSERIVDLFESGNMGSRNHWYALALAATGDSERALVELVDVWENLVGRIIVYPWFSPYHVAALMELQSGSGREQESADALGVYEQWVSNRAQAGIVGGNASWDAHFESGLLAWLQGDPEPALEQMKLAVERGYIIYPNEAYLQKLYDHPGFASIMEIQRERQQSERDKFLSLLCSDNPYAALWSPPEDYCTGLGEP